MQTCGRLAKNDELKKPRDAAASCPCRCTRSRADPARVPGSSSSITLSSSPQPLRCIGPQVLDEGPYARRPVVLPTVQCVDGHRLGSQPGNTDRHARRSSPRRPNHAGNMAMPVRQWRVRAAAEGAFVRNTAFTRTRASRSRCTRIQLSCASPAVRSASCFARASGALGSRDSQVGGAATRTHEMTSVVRDDVALLRHASTRMGAVDSFDASSIKRSSRRNSTCKPGARP